MIFSFNKWQHQSGGNFLLVSRQPFTTYKNKTTGHFFPEKKVSSLQQ